MARKRTATQLERDRLVKDVSIRIPVNEHADLVELLEELNKVELGRVYLQQYGLHAIREQMRKDKERFGIQ
ncbi:MAG: hypothetical protein VR69_03840 [Peptococcaceae bacterium BRH_c4b]|nr:MAG: hypothetical protein VR69_03840 [Peptococcaceae bacterium BRH_c4b]